MAAAGFSAAHSDGMHSNQAADTSQAAKRSSTNMGAGMSDGNGRFKKQKTTQQVWRLGNRLLCTTNALDVCDLHSAITSYYSCALLVTEPCVLLA